MKILLVDEHGVVREGLRRLLSIHFNATIFDAADVESALEIYKRDWPDVIVLDLNLEGTGGLEIDGNVTARACDRRQRKNYHFQYAS